MRKNLLLCKTSIQLLDSGWGCMGGGGTQKSRPKHHILKENQLLAYVKRKLHRRNTFQIPEVNTFQIQILGAGFKLKLDSIKPAQTRAF